MKAPEAGAGGAAGAAPGDRPRTGGVGFWAGVVLGVSIMAFGVLGLLDATPASRPSEVAWKLVGLNLVHDALIAPIACATGWVLARWLPAPIRAPVRAAVLASVLVLVVGWPALRGYGRAHVPDNATVDPGDRVAGVLVVLGATWTIALGWTAANWLRARRPSRAPTPG